MITVLGFAGSNSRQSINYKFAEYSCRQLKEVEIRMLNLANYPFPLYSIDLEKEEGFSNSLTELKEMIQQSNGLVISVSEHNSMPSAYFKNLLDWLSRLERQFLENTKVLLLATSPGKRGGQSALEATAALLPRFGAEVVARFSLPSFGENFDAKDGVLPKELKTSYEAALSAFEEALKG